MRKDFDLDSTDVFVWGFGLALGIIGCLAGLFLVVLVYACMVTLVATPVIYLGMLAAHAAGFAVVPSFLSALKWGLVADLIYTLVRLFVKWSR